MNKDDILIELSGEDLTESPSSLPPRPCAAPRCPCRTCRTL